MKLQAGFSLIEVLLSVAIIAMLAGMSLPIYASFQSRNDLDITTQSIASMLRRAQLYSRGVSGHSTWGVRVQTGGATLFKGGTYAARDAAYDEVTTIAPSVVVGGLSEVTYTQLDGTPSTTGNITLTLNTDEIRTITLNAKGTVDY